jgi:hypothetical protein
MQFSLTQNHVKTVEAQLAEKERQCVELANSFHLDHLKYLKEREGLKRLMMRKTDENVKLNV